MLIRRALFTIVSGLYTPCDNYIMLCYDSILGAFRWRVVVLFGVAVCCSGLQCVAVCCSVFEIECEIIKSPLACRRTIWFLKKENSFSFYGMAVHNYATP